MRHKLKSIFTILSILLVLLCITVGFLDTYEAKYDEIHMNSVLSEYFENRENEFIGQDVVQMSRDVSRDGFARQDAIAQWKTDLKIDISSVEIEYSVRDIITNTEKELKILVYEWVWIEYLVDTSNCIEKMGFGTDHMITFEKANDQLILVSDVYSEVIGFESGTTEELAELKAETMCVKEDRMRLEEENIDTMQIHSSSVTLPSYSAEYAVAYSEAWCGNSAEGTSSGTMTPANYNPSYYYYKGADCCNFVSQCLECGNLDMDDVWKATLNTSGVVTADTSFTKSTLAWCSVPDFKSYWMSQGFTVRQINDSSQAIIGNPIFWLKSDGYNTNHVMLIVGTNNAGYVLVNGHNYDMYKYPINLSQKTYYMLDLAHDYTFDEITSTTHSGECSFCGYVQEGTHFYEVVNGSYLRCKTCGYRRSF